jgi:5-methylcytosine-specific restriction endonuclease McrA
VHHEDYAKEFLMISLKEIIFKYDNTCFYCGKKILGELRPTRDHVHPKSKGGDNEADNLVLACNKCNSRKSDYYLIDFLELEASKGKNKPIKGISNKNRKRKKRIKSNRKIATEFGVEELY